MIQINKKKSSLHKNHFAGDLFLFLPFFFSRDVPNNVSIERKKKSVSEEWKCVVALFHSYSCFFAHKSRVVLAENMLQAHFWNYSNANFLKTFEKSFWIQKLQIIAGRNFL